MKTLDQISIRTTAIALLTGMLFLTSCQKYGEVSPRAYDIAKALYSICNRKDAARLSTVEKLVTDSVAEGALTDSESGYLMAIVEKARSDNWESAMSDARLMMSEQIQN
ncbi:MAG: hypothetical protein O2955_17975 [Planctomycetota bacterium]|nr:hypothetical protein [Planctomycetota bacterium]MDA1214401.1 hypothetical protein [Planctomycetota bacterium]